MTYGVAPDVFAPVLSRLECDASRYFGLEPLRFVRTKYSEHPYSHILRLGVCHGADEKPISHLFVKIAKDKRHEGHSVLQAKIACDFAANSLAHRAMGPTAMVGAVPPVACYPDLLAIVTEEITGPTLMQFLYKHARWWPSRRGLAALSAVMTRVGEWVRRYQQLAPAGDPIPIADFRSYVDHRLKIIIEHSRGRFTEEDRGRILLHIDRLGREVAASELTEVAVHADLGLGNILVSNGRVVVLDFAMASRGLRLQDLTRVFVQLDLLRTKPFYSARVVRTLQKALLAGYDPALSPETPLFRLLCLRHRVNHLGTLTVNPGRLAEGLFNAHVRRLHRRWIESELSRTPEAINS